VDQGGVYLLHFFGRTLVTVVQAEKRQHPVDAAGGYACSSQLRCKILGFIRYTDYVGQAIAY